MQDDLYARYWNWTPEQLAEQRAAQERQNNQPGATPCN